LNLSSPAVAIKTAGRPTNRFTRVAARYEETNSDWSVASLGSVIVDADSTLHSIAKPNISKIHARFAMRHIRNRNFILSVGL
jgi:hypothetical protein